MAERAHPEDPGFKPRLWGLWRNRYRRNLFRRYKFCSRYVKDKIVLDIPCGVGWGTSLLKSAKKFYGIDISKEAVQYGVQHYKNITFAMGNMNNIPFSDNSMDAIICLEGFEHVDKETGLKFLSEAKRVCRSEGILILTCPILNEKGESSGNPHHIKEYEYSELVEVLKQHFQIDFLKIFKGPDGREVKTICKIIK